MKKILAVVALLASTLAHAGDEPKTTVAYTGTAGCTAALDPKTRFSVQCTTDCYVRVTKDTTNATATSNSVKVPADKLYDVWTTKSKVYICAVQVASGGTLKVFTYQDGSND